MEESKNKKKKKVLSKITKLKLYSRREERRH